VEMPAIHFVDYFDRSSMCIKLFTSLRVVSQCGRES